MMRFLNTKKERKKKKLQSFCVNFLPNAHKCHLPLSQREHSLTRNNLKIKYQIVRVSATNKKNEFLLILKLGKLSFFGKAPRQSRY